MMASACVDAIGMPPESFLSLPPYPSYGWISPRISFSRENDADGVDDSGDPTAGRLPEAPDSEVSWERDFEFRLDDPVAMLTADELFSGGKLMPLHESHPATSIPTSSESLTRTIREPMTLGKPRPVSEMVAAEFCALSPKAPRCSSRWRDILGLKRFQSQSQKVTESAAPAKNPATATSSSWSTTKAPRSLKLLVRVGSDSRSCSNDSSSLSLPLLSDPAPVGDSAVVPVSVTSSRSCLSSSSFSCPGPGDPPTKSSLDSEKPIRNPKPSGVSNASSTDFLNLTPPRVRLTTSGGQNVTGNARARIGRSPVRRVPESGSVPARGASVDSPRMNPSGKIVFLALERSSSSPSTFNGGPRNVKDPYYRHRDTWKGMERSYSANVRVTPVLNVPVCSLASKGAIFGLFSQPKKEAMKPNRIRNDRV